MRQSLPWWLVCADYLRHLSKKSLFDTDDSAFKRRFYERMYQVAITGYSIIKADSLDEAVAKAKGCPVLQGGAQIVVLETFNVM